MYINVYILYTTLKTTMYYYSMLLNNCGPVIAHHAAVYIFQPCFPHSTPLKPNASFLDFFIMVFFQSPHTHKIQCCMMKRHRYTQYSHTTTHTTQAQYKQRRSRIHFHMAWFFFGVTYVTWLKLTLLANTKIHTYIYEKV